MSSDLTTLAAGPKADWLVARNVMGWTPWRSPSVPRGSTTPDCWMTGNERSPTVRISGWRPSEDIAAAWLVVDRLVSLGARVNVMNRAVGPWACHLILRIGTPDERTLMEYGETPALAICRAALAAVESSAHA